MPKVRMEVKHLDEKILPTDERSCSTVYGGRASSKSHDATGDAPANRGGGVSKRQDGRRFGRLR